MTTLTTAVAVALLVASGGGPTGRPDAEVGPAAVSITVSGGVSLGAYEAGFLSYFAARNRGDPMRLRILTGASAGSLNALLELLAACGTDAPSRPTESLFWRTWIPVGFEQLSESPASTLGAFSRHWLERSAAQIEAAWARGLDPSCDVVLGVSVTRAQARLVRSAGGSLELPRIEEKIAIRVQGRGPGHLPHASNYTLPTPSLHGPLLVTDDRGEIAFSEIRDLILASMAFPVAFPPMSLRTCFAGETATPGICLESEARRDLYVDGGVFDNAPLRTAVWLAGMGLHQPDPRSRRLEWRSGRGPNAEGLPRDVTFAFIDPDATDFPRPAVDHSDRVDSIVEQLLVLSSAFVATARAKELSTLAEELPDIADRIVFPRRQFPAAGGPLGAFLGFFDTEFRVFDFHLGMYDAQLLDQNARLPEPELDILAAGAPDAAGWERFRCMRAVYVGAPDAARACGGEGMADFRVLLQVSLDKLYVACSAPAISNQTWSNPHCARAAGGASPPRVPGVLPRRAPDWRRTEGETELAYTVRLLVAYGFRFADLELPPDRGDLAIGRIRQKLGRVARQLAAAQPIAQREPVTFATKLAVDSLAYSPPDRTFHLTMGPTESELGLSQVIADASRVPPHLRVAGAIAFRGLEGAFTSRDASPFATLLLAGLEIQPRLSPVAQLRVGLRGGWLAAERDRAGSGSCSAGTSASVSACSRPVAQTIVGVAVLERFRIQVVGEWFPGFRSRPSAWSIAPGIGLELGF